MTAMESGDGKNRDAASGTPEKKNACAIFLCGGSGSRMRGSVADKIFAPLAGTPALAFSLRAFEAAGIFARRFLNPHAIQRRNAPRALTSYGKTLGRAGTGRHQ